ncbi:hypothetical protein B0H16DRAFT_1368950 [Mycena metata]|uniref:Uncharacterized protein n=1 Tax=Mycena metata TaxID=1033252 RepID=A0AAD7JCQ5_9AGAR|nr:hypothetical protein B0H16DRAFT_1368950 [Mycena metata]
MHQATIFGAVLASALCSRAAQTPFFAVDSLPATKNDSWNLNVKPSVNATGHLVFDTVSSLLQHWPNTRYRNGHNIVPGIVPVGTLLYHGRGDSNLPTIPEWTATDPEHSYIFCRGSSEAGCWHLTLVTSRPLRVLYFDGSSAAKMKDGPMDTQDIVGWGEVLPDRYFEERTRAVDLCNWGKPLGIDGYVRMEMDFEIVLCDLTAGVEVVSMANLASQGRGGPGGPGPGGPGGPGRPRPSDLPASNDSLFATGPFEIAAGGFDVIHSGSWHNRYPGDRRIKLDLTQLISFYDTALVPSLVARRLNLERWDHRLLGIIPVDVAAVMARLTQVHASPLQPGSGVDWDTLFKVIVDRYEDRFEMVQYVLNSTSDDALATAKNAMALFRVMLQPYILHATVPVGSDNAWAAPVFKFCATSHTEYIRRSLTLFNKLTLSEELLLNAVEETNREICRVVVRAWAQGVAAGLDDALPVDSPTHPDGKALVSTWKADIEQLMAWLDWSVWIKCRPECSFEEMCYLPTWPFMGGGGRGGPGRRPERPDSPRSSRTHVESSSADDDDYLRPQPRCVRRLEPYTQL